MSHDHRHGSRLDGTAASVAECPECGAWMVPNAASWNGQGPSCPICESSLRDEDPEAHEAA